MSTTPGSTLLPPTDLPPVGFDPDSGDEPPARIWRIYNPVGGITGKGYWVPDAFPTRGDAVSWLRAHAEFLPKARVGAWVADQFTLDALQGDNAA